MNSKNLELYSKFQDLFLETHIVVPPQEKIEHFSCEDGRLDLSKFVDLFSEANGIDRKECMKWFLSNMGVKFQDLSDSGK